MAEHRYRGLPGVGAIEAGAAGGPAFPTYPVTGPCLIPGVYDLDS